MPFDPSQLSDRAKVQIIGAVVAIVVLAVLLTRCVSYARITGDQVAVIMNNITGKPKLHEEIGAILYFPIFQDVYVLDKTRQTLEMTAVKGRGDRPGQDDVAFKTSDGSDVNVDITINYEIDPSMAVEILETSGAEDPLTGTDAYKTKWIRDYARTICRYKFGELSTEQFYVASEREGKAAEAREMLNKMLGPWGIRVTEVIPQSFRFYPEYEAKIREKKEADQEVQEQESKAEAASEKQKLEMMSASKEMIQEVARYQGQIDQRRVAAQADRQKIISEADAYATTTRAAAEAEFTKLENEAKGITATKAAEAEGIKALVAALSGPGGPNLVKMEYAKQLANLRLTGTPVAIGGLMEKFEHSAERQRKAAASTPSAVSEIRRTQ